MAADPPEELFVDAITELRDQLAKEYAFVEFLEGYMNGRLPSHMVNPVRREGRRDRDRPDDPRRPLAEPDRVPPAADTRRAQRAPGGPPGRRAASARSAPLAGETDDLRGALGRDSPYLARAGLDRTS